jgi:lauroyl/myristoyl acyltransferase
VDRWYARRRRFTPLVEADATRNAASAEALRLLDAAVADPSPLVLFGDHLGALELAVPALEARGRSVRAVAARDPEAALRLAGVGDSTRSVGSRAEPVVADGSVASGLRMLKALRSGEILAFKADRALPGAAPSDLVELPFLGLPARFPRGPAEVARLGRARVLAISVFRAGPGRISLRATPIPADPKDAGRTVAAYAAALERHARSRPDQWFNFYPFWERDAHALDWMPETIPPGFRAALPGLAGGVLAASVVAAAQSSGALLRGACWAALGGLLWAYLAALTGARVDRAGRRDLRARLVAAVPPLCAVALLRAPVALEAVALACGLLGSFLLPAGPRAARIGA